MEEGGEYRSGSSECAPNSAERNWSPPGFTSRTEICGGKFRRRTRKPCAPGLSVTVSGVTPRISPSTQTGSPRPDSKPVSLRSALRIVTRPGSGVAPAFPISSTRVL